MALLSIHTMKKTHHKLSFRLYTDQYTVSDLSPLGGKKYPYLPPAQLLLKQQLTFIFFLLFSIIRCPLQMPAKH